MRESVARPVSQRGQLDSFIVLRFIVGGVLSHVDNMQLNGIKYNSELDMYLLIVSSTTSRFAIQFSRRVALKHRRDRYINIHISNVKHPTEHHSRLSSQI